MANLPSQHPHLSLHLSDRALTPLITSARTQYQLDALTSLSHTALSAHESALRLNLGVPQRVVVEHAGSGPVILQSFLRASTPSSPASAPPRRHANEASAGGSTTPVAAPLNGLGLTSTAADDPGSDPSTPVSPSASPTTTTTLEQRLTQLQLASDDPSALDAAEDAEDADAPPMLVSLVVAPSADEARDGRRAAARLERVGREIQMRWAEAQEDGDGQQRATSRGGAGAGDAGD
ncbi:hypothetical protein F5B19DRAFT_451332 [Rostrohypoxylon terebratum]|nr:hypothetical protein F5B19DRAFT_451332 [Rostrohypoxylon terebratum]